jgi:NDP-sugar pyrophosphorylase family protein
MQRRTTMSENERRHHENQIRSQMMEKEQEETSFNGTYRELKDKFEHDRQRIGTVLGCDNDCRHVFAMYFYILEDEDRARMLRELHKEEELVRLSQKMMEDNEFRLRSTIEASENEIRAIAEFFTEKIREAENELVEVDTSEKLV